MPTTRLSRAVNFINRLPQGLRPSLLSLLFATQVRFAGTARIRVDSLTRQQACLTLRNRRRVGNHVGGIHAAAMALLAESATGFVVGMSVPDTHLLLIKTLHVDYRRRATGSLRALATLTPEQLMALTTQTRGEMAVQVAITDESGQQPITCEMIWAWLPRQH